MNYYRITNLSNKPIGIADTILMTGDYIDVEEHVAQLPAVIAQARLGLFMITPLAANEPATEKPAEPAVAEETTPAVSEEVAVDTKAEPKATENSEQPSEAPKKKTAPKKKATKTTK